MSDVKIAVKSVIDQEGSAVVPNDNGRGPSKYGITLVTYQEYYPKATAEDIRALTPETSAAFYEMAFWKRYRIGRIDDQTLATKMLNLVVNMGAGGWSKRKRRLIEGAVTLLQKAIAVKQDGILGPETAAKVNALPAEEVLVKLRECAREHYKAIAAADPKKRGQLGGWLERLKT